MMLPIGTVFSDVFRKYSGVCVCVCCVVQANLQAC